MFSDAEQKKLGAKVVRLNFSELYQHLNVASLLEQLVDEGLITPAKRKEVDAYSGKVYAQNTAAVRAIFSSSPPPTFFLQLCDILEASTQHSRFATKLQSSEYIKFYHC